ncbi:hypothetical protein ZWY2020_011558 [Hordeum vulgare]|nr:hypothetical protein ZWY2020_011558 [Hordeum vulgare]
MAACSALEGGEPSPTAPHKPLVQQRGNRARHPHSPVAAPPAAPHCSAYTNPSKPLVARPRISFVPSHSLARCSPSSRDPVPSQVSRSRRHGAQGVGRRLAILECVGRSDVCRRLAGLPEPGCWSPPRPLLLGSSHKQQQSKAKIVG